MVQKYLVLTLCFCIHDSTDPGHYAPHYGYIRCPAHRRWHVSRIRDVQIAILIIPLVRVIMQCYNKLYFVV